MALDPALVASIPDSMTFDDNGTAKPLRDHDFVKNTPDFPTLVKTAFDNHREVGARIPVRLRATTEAEKVTEIADWKKNHLPKIYEAGFLPKPPASPDDYNDAIKKPDTLPDGFGWSDDLTNEFKMIAHKHGIPKAAIPDLLALHEKTITGVSNVLKSNEETTMAELKKEFGDAFEPRMELAKRLVDYVVKTPEEVEFFDRTKLGNSPTLLGVFMRLAPLAQQDSSFFASQPSKGGNVEGDGTIGSTSHEAVRRELADIASNKENPRYKGYWNNAPEVQQYINALYKKAGFQGQVEIS